MNYSYEQLQDLLREKQEALEALQKSHQELREAAIGMQAMVDAVFRKINWGASHIGAHEAAFMNEAPVKLALALQTEENSNE